MMSKHNPNRKPLEIALKHLKTTQNLFLSREEERIIAEVKSQIETIIN